MRTVILTKDDLLVEHLRSCFVQNTLVREIDAFEDLYQGMIYIINELPDVVVVDLTQFASAALDLCSNIRKNYPAIAVVFVAEDERYVSQGFELGIVEYLMKPVKEPLVDRLVEKVRNRKRPEKRVKIKTFGHFDVYVDNELLYFNNTKAKELLALLVDRRGTVSMEMAVGILWENHFYDQNVKQLYRKAVSYLRRLFEQHEIDIFVANRGSCYVRINDFDCDYYRLLQGDVETVAQFHDEYMFEYPWAEETLVQIQRQLHGYPSFEQQMNLLAKMGED